MFEGEYVGYDSSISIKSYRVSGSRDVRRALKQGNDVRLGRMISWPREQLAQESFTFGRNWAELPRGHCTMCLRRWDSEQVLMGLILDKNQQQRDPVKLPNR
jgi:hypothetical protein